MNDVLKYKLKGTWTRNNNRTGQISTKNISTTIGAQTPLNQSENVTNPEELFLSAAASCYMITLSLLLENRNIPYVNINLESEAILENVGGLRLDKIIHYPHVIIDHTDSVDMDKIIKLMHHAEHTCMVSSALRGNVDVVVYPQVTAKEATQNA